MKCQKCGGEFVGSPGDLCPHCGNPGVEHQRSGPPWERREELGLWNAIVETIKGVLLNPHRTFTDMRIEGGLGKPLLFAISMGFIGGILGRLMLSLILSNRMGQIPFANSAITSISLGSILIVMPLMILFSLIISSGVYHFWLMILGGAKKDYEATFRVVCYVYGSTAPLQIVPYLGYLLTFVWSIVCNIIGLRQTHEIPTRTASIVVLLSIVFCCGAPIIMLGSTILSFIASLRGAMP